MSAENIQRDFPLLHGESYNPPRSAADFNYNCLAFAVGDVNNWWEPASFSGCYWPPGFPSDLTLQTAVGILKAHGFTFEHEPTHTPFTEAIAIYAIGNEWTHFAKLSPEGWLSKLGAGHDIRHSSLAELEGDLYGKAIIILSRPQQALP